MSSSRDKACRDYIFPADLEPFFWRSAGYKDDTGDGFQLGTGGLPSSFSHLLLAVPGAPFLHLLHQLCPSLLLRRRSHLMNSNNTHKGLMGTWFYGVRAGTTIHTNTAYLVFVTNGGSAAINYCILSTAQVIERFELRNFVMGQRQQDYATSHAPGRGADRWVREDAWLLQGLFSAMLPHI